MIKISVTHAIRAIDSAKKELGEKKFATTVSRALNESVMQARTVGRSQVKPSIIYPSDTSLGLIFSGQHRLSWNLLFTPVSSPSRWMLLHTRAGNSPFRPCLVMGGKSRLFELINDGIARN